MNERRRAPRVKVSNEFASVPTHSKVQVLEISTAGVLLRTSRPLTPGTKGTLRLNLGGEPFAAALEIRRVGPSPDSSLTFVAGGALVALTPENAQLLTRFISQ